VSIAIGDEFHFNIKQIYPNSFIRTKLQCKLNILIYVLGKEKCQIVALHWHDKLQLFCS